MKLKFLFAPAAVLAAAACGGDTANENAGDADAGVMDDMPMDNLVMNGDANAASPGAVAAAVSAADFVTQAAASDLFEIESGKLAQQKAQNAEVKAFAGMLVADHEKSAADLKAAAARAQPAISVAPAMGADQQADMQALRAASGADFDSLFLSQQIVAHEKALGLVQGYASAGDVDALKQHASTVAGPIQKHLDRAKRLKDQVGR